MRRKAECADQDALPSQIAPPDAPPQRLSTNESGLDAALASAPAAATKAKLAGCTWASYSVQWHASKGRRETRTGVACMGPVGGDGVWLVSWGSDWPIISDLLNQVGGWPEPCCESGRALAVGVGCGWHVPSG